MLPSISGSVLTHTIGDPSSYPSTHKAYANAKAYNGDPAKVDFTAAGGGSGITQEISFSTSDSQNYTNTTSIETKAGAGAGGVTAGVVAGSEHSAGKVSVNTAGGSFSGSLQNMPIEAKPYGYGMNWKFSATTTAAAIRRSRLLPTPVTERRLRLRCRRILSRMLRKPPMIPSP